MLGALTTLAFLTTLWLVGVIAIRTLEESGAKIAAALAGPLHGKPHAMILQLRWRRADEPVSPSLRLLAAA